MSDSTVTPDSPCPYCGYVTDRSSNLSHPDDEQPRPPRPGDVGLCLSCGGVAVFDDDMRLREPTPVEHGRFQGDSAIAIAVDAILRVRRWRGPLRRRS